MWPSAPATVRLACDGDTFLALAVLRQRFRLRTDVREPPLDVGIVLRPSGPLRVHVAHRR